MFIQIRMPILPTIQYTTTGYETKTLEGFFVRCLFACAHSRANTHSRMTNHKFTIQTEWMNEKEDKSKTNGNLIFTYKFISSFLVYSYWQCMWWCARHSYFSVVILEWFWFLANHLHRRIIIINTYTQACGTFSAEIQFRLKFDCVSRSCQWHKSHRKCTSVCSLNFASQFSVAAHIVRVYTFTGKWRRAVHDCNGLNKLWYATKTFNFLDKFDRRRHHHHPHSHRIRCATHKTTYYFFNRMHAHSCVCSQFISMHFTRFSNIVCHSVSLETNEMKTKKNNRRRQKKNLEKSPLPYLCTFFVLFCGKFYC